MLAVLHVLITEDLVDEAFVVAHGTGWELLRARVLGEDGRGAATPEWAEVVCGTPAARIVALVNRYDNLCNPSRAAAAMTPHESLSLIFAQLKTRFDSVALSAFLRMMGVYPPGSVVQLMDERYGMVVSVNSARPLKPRVIVHEPGISKHDALILDLEDAVAPGEKDAARILVRGALTAYDYAGCEIIIRINPLGSGYTEEDIRAVVPLKPAVLMPTKVSSAKDIEIIS